MDNLASVGTILDLATKQYVDTRASVGFYAYSGRWRPAWYNPKTSLTISTTAKWIYAYRVSSLVSLQTVGVEVAAAAAGGTFRICVYSDSPPWPGTLLSSANLTADAIGIKTAAMSIGVGSFWLALHNTGTVPISMRTILGSNPYSPGSVDSSGASAMASGFAYNVASATSPPTWPAGTGADAQAIMFLLRAT